MGIIAASWEFLAIAWMQSLLLALGLANMLAVGKDSFVLVGPGLAVGGFVGGVWAGATHVTAYIMGSSSFLSILGYVGGGVLNTVNAGISDLLAMGIASAVTYATLRDGTTQSHR